MHDGGSGGGGAPDDDGVSLHDTDDTAGGGRSVGDGDDGSALAAAVAALPGLGGAGLSLSHAVSHSRVGVPPSAGCNSRAAFSPPSESAVTLGALLPPPQPPLSPLKERARLLPTTVQHHLPDWAASAVLSASMLWQK